MDLTPAPTALTDDQLLRRVADLVGRSRATEAEIVAHIAEVDARRLYAREACSSMFAYCTERLHFSEAEAYLRIAAARASREHPLLLAMLADGRLHLSAIERLAPHLTPDNRDGVLARAAHRTKRQVEELVAELAPRPDAPALVRRLPARASRAAPGRQAATDSQSQSTGASAGAPASVCLDLPGSAEGAGDWVSAAGGSSHRGGVEGIGGRTNDADGGAERPTLAIEPRLDGVGSGPRLAPVNRAVVEPMAPGRYKFQFTAGAELREKLERLQALMRRTAPDADLASIIEQAVSEKLERLEAVRFAKVKQPRAAVTAAPAVATPKKTARRIPAAIRRAVYARDGGRCRYTDRGGRRCAAEHDLEFHHRHPFGHGGAHTVANLALMCATHNGMIGEADYGRLGPPNVPAPRSRPIP